MKIQVTTTLAVALAISAGTTAQVARAAETKVSCAVSASTIGGKKFATLKCRKQGQTGGEDIRRTAWEHKDSEEYRELARIAGRRFSCTMKPAGQEQKPDGDYNMHTLSDCNI
jgi:hypothetical protein